MTLKLLPIEVTKHLLILRNYAIYTNIKYNKVSTEFNLDPFLLPISSQTTKQHENRSKFLDY
jgi:hypothetical protein